MNAAALVLHKRDRENRLRFARMISVSLLVHGQVIAVALLGSCRSTAFSYRESSLLVTFREAPLGPKAVAPAPTSATSAQPVSAPAPAQPAAKAAPEKAAPKKVEKVIPAEPTKAGVSKGGQAKTPVPAPIKVSSAERQSMDAALAALRVKVASSQAGAEQAEWNAAMADVESSLEARGYHELMLALLYDAWNPPYGDPRAAIPLYVFVEQDGTIADYEIVQPSGHAGLDASVERLFLKVKKLDPVPWDLGGKNLRLPYLLKIGAGEE